MHVTVTLSDVTRTKQDDVEAFRSGSRSDADGEGRGKVGVWIDEDEVVPAVRLVHVDVQSVKSATKQLSYNVPVSVRSKENEGI